MRAPITDTPTPTPTPTIGLPRRGAWAWAAGLLDRASGLQALEAHYRARPPAADPATFVRYALSALALDYRLQQGRAEEIPASGPLLIVANHPHGAAEGLALIDLLLQRRRDVRLLANELLQGLPELAPLLIAVDVFKAGVNGHSLRAALRHLKSGGALIVFPAGEVSRLQWRERAISDPPWSPGVALLAQRSGAAVLPVFVEGRSRWRSLAAGALHARLRTVLLARELLAQRGQTLGLRLGAIVEPRELARLPDSAQTEYLRLLTYGLGLGQGKPAGRGGGRVLAPLAEAIDPQRLAAEVAQLQTYRLLVKGEFELYLAPAAAMPLLLEELGRLREQSFRALDEGSGMSRDLDRYDRHYQHLLLWHRGEQQIVGAYRFGFTQAIVPRHGVDGLYTRSLFQYDAALLEHTGPAVELGRSFVAPAWQKSFQPLRLLWAGIAAVLVQQPQLRYLFGPVSISPAYSAASRRLIAATLSHHHADAELAQRIRPLNPPRERGAAEQLRVVSALADTRLLSRVIARLERGNGLPVLLRHYLELNGRFAGFNIDEAFGDTLDGLVFVKVEEIPARVLEHFRAAGE